MLKRISDNTFQIVVNIRESFEYCLNFKLQSVKFSYYCKTDDYHFDQEFRFSEFIDKDWIYGDDYEIVINLVKKSVDWYVTHNIISASTRRAWLAFSDEYCAALYSIIMLKFKL